jgi:hypothetical protein
LPQIIYRLGGKSHIPPDPSERLFPNATADHDLPLALRQKQQLFPQQGGAPVPYGDFLQIRLIGQQLHRFLQTPRRFPPSAALLLFKPIPQTVLYPAFRKADKRHPVRKTILPNGFHQG